MSATILFGVDASHWPSAISKASSTRESYKQHGVIHTSEPRCSQHLDKNQVLVASILDVVTVGLWEVTNISTHIVESSRLIGRREKRRSPLAFDKVGPFVTSGMPVNLAHTTRLDSHDGGGEIRRNGEGKRVDNLDGSARNLVSRLLGEVIRVALSAWHKACSCADIFLFDILWRRGSSENVELVFGNLVKCGGGYSEVLRQDLFLDNL